MRSYPIWVEIDSCIYKNKQSYGVKKHSEQQIKIGTSGSNSHHFATVELKHRERDGDRYYELYVDGQLVKKSVLHKGADKPETIIEARIQTV